jgi:hypothetical protein
MKIALCFAGQPRFIERMNFDNLVQDHDVDVYAHFWWDETYRGQIFAWNSSLVYPEDYDPIEEFRKIMNPKKLVYEKYMDFDLTNFKMVSQMEFPLTEDIVEQSIYRQKSQWTSIKKSIDLVEDEYDLVIRMRTDLEFGDRVPLELCNQDGVYIMDGSLQAGRGREYCDWFYLGPKHRMKEFDVLRVYDDFYKDGIRHMHELIYHTLYSLQIPHAVVNLQAWMLDRNKLESQ